MISLAIVSAELNASTPLTTRDVARIARISRVPEGYRMTRNAGRDIARCTTTCTPRGDITEADRAWYRRPLRALVLACTLAIGGHAAHADTSKRQDTSEVQRAKSEMATAKAHLKTARAHQREAHKHERAAAKVAKLRAQLKRAEDTALGCGTCTDNHDGSCTCPEGK